MRTGFTERFGLEWPLVQAPMAVSAGGELAQAVAAAGALGMIGMSVSVPATPEWLAEQMNHVHDRHRVGVGLTCWDLERRPDLFDAVTDLRPAALWFSFGDPMPWVGKAKEAGLRVIVQVQDTRSAADLASAGVDALVAQGSEAGGHTGRVSTLPLLVRLTELLEGTAVPVLAAGGITTGAAVAGVLAAGAGGAVLGSRFQASRESLASAAAKNRMVDAEEYDTRQSRVYDLAQRVPWPDSVEGRLLREGAVDEWEGLGTSEDAREGFIEHLRSGLGEGDAKLAPVYAGQGVGSITDIPSATDLVPRLGAEALGHLRRTASLLDLRQG